MAQTVLFISVVLQFTLGACWTHTAAHTYDVLVGRTIHSAACCMVLEHIKVCSTQAM